MNPDKTFTCLSWTTIALVGLLALHLSHGWSRGEEIQPNREPGVALGIQLGHSEPLSSAVFSPNGQLVLTASLDGTARLWEAASGRELRQFAGHHGPVTHAVFSSDGRVVLTAGADGSARLWEVASGRELRQLKFNMVDPPLTHAVFSPDGRVILTAGEGFEVQLWEVARGRVYWLAGHTGSVPYAVFSPDGRLILTVSDDGTARLWEGASGRELRQFTGHTDRVGHAEFSPDGRFVLTASWDHTARLWEVASGRELRQFTGHTDRVHHAVFSPDGRFVLTAGWDHTARLWEVASGRELRQFRGHTDRVHNAVFSPDGRFVLTAGGEKFSARLWEVAGGGFYELTGHTGSVSHAVFSPDGRLILTASHDGTARLWGVASGRELRQFTGHTWSVRHTVFSPDGRLMLTVSDDGTAWLWEVATGRELRQFTGHAWNVNHVVFSPDSRVVLIAGWDGTARLWEMASGRELQRFIGFPKGVTHAVFSPDGEVVLTAGVDGTVRAWEVASGRELRQFTGHTWSVRHAVFSPDGRLMLTVSDDGTAWLWEVATGRELRRFTVHARDIRYSVFSPDSRVVLIASVDGGDHVARVWEVASGRELQRFIGFPEGVTHAAFSPDSRVVLTASSDGLARLREVASGRELRQFTGYTGTVTHAAFSPDGHWVLTTSRDHTVRLWEVATGHELGSLISFTDGTWAVIAPDGRFDTNNLEDIKGLHWIMPDDPMRALPLEVFMRDYYEPRLLSRMMAGEKLRAIRPLTELNRAQPKVEIMRVELEESQAGLAAVTVEVASDTSEILREGKSIVMESGAYDLRLFRNGQLVGQFPDAPHEQLSGEQTREQAIAQWRKQHAITLEPKTEKKTITFRGIKLPRTAGLKDVEFTAYAFNVDRVKSATARRTFPIPKELTPRQGKAYVVTIGVNRFEGNLMPPLTFAVNDAMRLNAELTTRLKTATNPQTNQPLFGEANVVSLKLVKESDSGGPTGAVNSATKQRIKAVIDKLAGKRVDLAQLEGIPNVDQLQPAQPEDLVLIGFSTHGDTDKNGQFYLMPSDLGEGSDLHELRRHAISSEELSTWLRPVDAGEMVMIVDACHSAATVENKEFKPGPMGSRGLGQLAFDKGMRILAASQRDQAALETESTQQGLLSYALVREGLGERAADFQPKDGRIQLAEWLNYGAQRVPGLYEDYRTGKLKARAATPLDQREGKQFISIQQPALFDFARGRDFPLVSGTGR